MLIPNAEIYVDGILKGKMDEEPFMTSLIGFNNDSKSRQVRANEFAKKWLNEHMPNNELDRVIVQACSPTTYIQIITTKSPAICAEIEILKEKYVEQYNQLTNLLKSMQETIDTLEKHTHGERLYSPCGFSTVRERIEKELRFITPERELNLK